MGMSITSITRTAITWIIQVSVGTVLKRRRVTSVSSPSNHKPNRFQDSIDKHLSSKGSIVNKSHWITSPTTILTASLNHLVSREIR